MTDVAERFWAVSMLAVLAASLLGTAPSASWAQAPSRAVRTYDCSKAALTVDFVICGQEKLVDLAEQLGRTWSTTRAKLTDPATREALLADQRRWIDDYTAACGVPGRDRPNEEISRKAAPCVETKIRDRITYLESYSPASVVTTVPSSPASEEQRATPRGESTASAFYARLLRLAKEKPRELWQDPELLDVLRIRLGNHYTRFLTGYRQDKYGDVVDGRWLINNACAGPFCGENSSLVIIDTEKDGFYLFFSENGAVQHLGLFETELPGNVRMYYTEWMREHGNSSMARSAEAPVHSYLWMLAFIINPVGVEMSMRDARPVSDYPTIGACNADIPSRMQTAMNDIGYDPDSYPISRDQAMAGHTAAWHGERPVVMKWYCGGMVPTPPRGRLTVLPGQLPPSIDEARIRREFLDANSRIRPQSQRPATIR